MLISNHLKELIWWLPTHPATCEPCARSLIAHYWSLSQDKADLLLKRVSLSCVLWEWLSRMQKGFFFLAVGCFQNLALAGFSKLPTLALNSHILSLWRSLCAWENISGSLFVKVRLCLGCTHTSPGRSFDHCKLSRESLHFTHIVLANNLRNRDRSG